MRTPFLIVAIAITSLAASAAQAQNEARPAPVSLTYRLKQQGGGLGIFIDEAAVVSAVGAGADRVWVVEGRRRDSRLGKVTLRHAWIDGRACPALRPVLEAVARLPAVGIAHPDAAPGGWVSDTPQVTLIGPTADGGAGDLVLRRDMGGPVSRWKAAGSWRPAGRNACLTSPAPTTSGSASPPPRTKWR